VADAIPGAGATPITEDMVNHPPHYTQGKYECIDVIEDVVKELKGMDAVDTANAFKYMWRWPNKNGSKDVKKAIWYMINLAKRLEAEGR
jgi:hypothetical protein